jgi:hypothetical protein
LGSGGSSLGTGKTTGRFLKFYPWYFMARQLLVMQQVHGRLLLVAVVAGALGVWCTWPHSPKATGAAPTRDDAPTTARETLQWQGVASCSAMACHNSNEGRGHPRSEYTTWLAYDKHEKAYTVLLNSQSQWIERNYRRLKDLKDAHPEKDATCLKCHSLSVEGQMSEVDRLDGVGCEGCHGAAQKWLSEHYLPGFKELSDREKLERFGMQPTKNLMYRVKMCAECHVGAPDRNVNHDLYGAGHPPLHYEFSAYMAAMPRHWSLREEKERYPDFEARAWVLGQVVNAQASLALLAHRADDTNNPWPEFAEYNCFACHHDLKFPSWRQSRAHYEGRGVGALPWGTWFTSVLPEAVEAGGSGAAVKGLKDLLEDIANQMQRPYPNRKEVAQKAGNGAQKLQAVMDVMERAPIERAAAERLFRSIAANKKLAEASWDSATQAYLALAALYHALGKPGEPDPALKASLQARARRLALPKGFDSPRDFVPMDPSLLRQGSPR